MVESVMTVQFHAAILTRIPSVRKRSKCDSSQSRCTSVVHAKKKPPDYAERRRGGQDENNRRRANAHQNALRARRVEAHSVYDGPPTFARAASRKGTMYDTKTRRRGRPAHLRSPDDSPLRDGNRDRVIGLLTERAARTLLYYFMETNLNYHHWLGEYIKRNPIPRDGKWDDVSGETFLRTLLTGGITEAKAQVSEDLFSCVRGLGIDPRAIAQRIMEIRTALAAEFIQDLESIAEENAILMRECAMASLITMVEPGAVAAAAPGAPAEAPPVVLHPEMSEMDSISIPDSATQFLAEATETELERFERQKRMLEEAGVLASFDSATESSSEDDFRPGVDDINEFESELEAPDKWKRRFRLMKQDKAEDSSKGGTPEARGGDAAADGGTAAGPDASQSDGAEPGKEDADGRGSSGDGKGSPPSQ